MNISHDTGVARQIGKYSDAVEVPSGARLLFLSGTPGLGPNGELSPNFEEQATQAWRNVVTALEKAGMRVQDLVKVVQYLVRVEDLATYPAVRARALGDHRPASMLSVVAALPRADFLIEIEAYAAAPGSGR
jgi:enamine deaminase RidA (YjgF/YER057c/UK114 family)